MTSSPQKNKQEKEDSGTKKRSGVIITGGVGCGFKPFKRIDADLRLGPASTKTGRIPKVFFYPDSPLPGLSCPFYETHSRRETGTCIGRETPEHKKIKR